MINTRLDGLIIIMMMIMVLLATNDQLTENMNSDTFREESGRAGGLIYGNGEVNTIKHNDGRILCYPLCVVDLVLSSFRLHKTYHVLQKVRIAHL